MSNIVKNPPFLFTYWNPLNENSSLVGSWFDYVKDTSLAKYNADSVGQYIAQASNEQVSAIEFTGRRICGALYEGFTELQNQLNLVTNALQGLNQRLNLVLDETKTSNLLQENMAELLRIPESQKQRQHHIEMGLKFLKNALKDEDLYQDALRELLEAEKLMPSDYFVLHRIGMIYLYVPALGNLEKALDYFSRAAKYAFVESHPDAARLSNILNKNVTKRFAEQAEVSATDLKAHAAESYFEAGTSLYALGRFIDAVKMAEKAVNCQPNEAKNRFFMAKYLIRSNNPDLAIPQLQKAIALVPEMALAAVGDFDLNQSQPILDLLESLNKIVNSELTDNIQSLEEVKTDAGILPWIASAKECLQKASYPQKLDYAKTYVEVQFSLGKRYYDGLGVAKDEMEAVKWFRKGADQNHAGAQYMLGTCYHSGRGVAKDEMEAVKWFRKAAEQDHAGAQYKLGICYHSGRGVVKDEMEAVKWYLKASKQNHADAQSILGFCYLNGHGVAKDKTEAVKWYRKAVALGHEGAAIALDGLGG